MGEAKRRAVAIVESDAAGIPRPRDPGCPVCHARHIAVLPHAEFVAFLGLRDVGIDCDWHTCLACKAVWEPFPVVYARDPVCADPCDNCAFRPGSPEQRDSARWKTLLEKLEPDAMFDHGVFYCHKGVPIDMSKGPGNFLFPERPVMMDGKPLRNADGSPVTTCDLAKMRTCSGFLRMVWARRRKREKVA